MNFLIRNGKNSHVFISVTGQCDGAHLFEKLPNTFATGAAQYKHETLEACQVGNSSSVLHSTRFLVFNTYLTLLYKSDIEGFKHLNKNKMEFELSTPTPSIRIPATLPIQPQRHLLNRRFMNWTWIISGSIEQDFVRVWKFETGMTDKLAEWVRWLKFYRWGWCCEFKSHWGQLYFLLRLFKTLDVTFVLKCQICVENEKPEWFGRKVAILGSMTSNTSTTVLEFIILLKQLCFSHVGFESS